MMFLFVVGIVETQYGIITNTTSVFMLRRLYVILRSHTNIGLHTFVLLLIMKTGKFAKIMSEQSFNNPIAEFCKNLIFESLRMANFLQREFVYFPVTLLGR